MQGSFDPARAEPAYLVANYEFTGAAMVELDGTVKYVIYKYTGME